MGDLGWADLSVISEFFIMLGFLLTFIVGYHVSTGGAWARSREGRHMMNFVAALSAVMIIGVLHNVFKDYPVRDLVRVLVYLWLDVAGFGRLRLLYLAQRQRRRDQARAKAITAALAPSADQPDPSR